MESVSPAGTGQIIKYSLSQRGLQRKCGEQENQGQEKKKKTRQENFSKKHIKGVSFTPMQNYDNFFFFFLKPKKQAWL